MFAKNKKMILAKTRGKINKLVFKVELKSNLLTMHTAITNIRRIKTIFVIG